MHLIHSSLVWCTSMPLLWIAPLVALLMAVSVNASAQADDPSTSASRPGDWAHLIDDRYNLYQITPTLYRSRQPDAAALPLLKQLGVVTVVNFMKTSDSTWLSDPSMTQIQIPLQTVHITDADILQSLRAIQSAEGKGPVLMHCKHGLDRTGLVSAMYRIVVQGWSKQAALDEMEHGGYGDEGSLKHGINYINNVDVEALKAALDSGACSTSTFAGCAIKGWFQKTDVVGASSILWRL